MQVDSKVRDIINRVFDGLALGKDEILFLLRIDHRSTEAGLVMVVANEIARTTSKGKAEVHAQIGLNLSPCPNNCSFCAFSAENRLFTEKKDLGIEEIIHLSFQTEGDGANAIFFMTTHDYPFGKYIEISKEVRKRLKPETVMIANVGDFGYREAKQLKDAGYAGIYHAVRMGEGKDTRIAPEIRLNTIKAAREAGLLIGTCVEPIGPEHSIEEITEKILIRRDINPCYSGAMRRINISGSPLDRHGMISEYRLAFLVAVVRLAMGRGLTGNCTHEPNVLGAIVGANPRDTEFETSRGRGLDVRSCMRMFKEADFDVIEGPSMIYKADAFKKSP